jgi:hypothetical protein
LLPQKILNIFGQFNRHGINMRGRSECVKCFSIFLSFDDSAGESPTETTESVVLPAGRGNCGLTGKGGGDIFSPSNGRGSETY